MELERKQIIISDNLKKGFIPEENTDYIIYGDNRSVSVRCFLVKHNCEGGNTNFGNAVIKTDRVTVEYAPENTKTAYKLIVRSEDIEVIVTVVRNDSEPENHLYGALVYSRQ